MAVSISIAITQNSQSIANNTSNVTVKVNASWTYGSYNKLDKSGYLVIDGTKYTFTSPFNTGVTTSGSQTLFTKTVNVAHNSNGTKTLACSASYTSGVSSGTVTASASKVLTTIPRKSTLSVANGALGTAQTLTVTRQATGFTHTITYSCGTAAGTICTKSSDTSISFTPPLSLASQNTTGTSVSVKYTITTYSGNTNIGSNSYTKTCSIPSSVKPSCSITVTDANGYSGTYGFIKGLSAFKIVVTPTTSYGSAIATYKTTANGATYTSASFTTGVIKSSGTLTVSSSVTDKRGRSGSASKNVTVLDYTPPVVELLTVKRCDADGTENAQGEYVQVTYSANVSSLSNKNTASYAIHYKPTGEQSYTVVDLTEYANVYSVSNGTYIFAADSGSSYDVEFYVTDAFKTTKRATSASTAFSLLHFHPEGTGVGIGKLSEEPNLLDVGLYSRFKGAVSGKVYGLDKLPEIPANSNLNDYMETGCYAVYRNDNAGTIANIPIAQAGRLDVLSATGEGVRVSQWSYLRQIYKPYNMTNATWEREITRSADNVWTYGEWARTSLTPSASKKVYHEQKVLWEGGRYMTADHTINLAEKVSEQPNGIVLTFCKYADGAPQANNYNHFFVPKAFVELHGGYGNAFTMMDINFGQICHKYLYINDATISGHANNSASGTGASGIAYNNSKYVLRYVFGV